jgi:Zn-finger protein
METSATQGIQETELNYLQRYEISYRRRMLQIIKRAGIDFSLANLARIIEETSFAVMSQKHSKESPCPYYKEAKQCHLEVKDLNCFLCPCPNYASESLEGGCRINSSRGKIKEHPNLPQGRIWDCSSCFLYHTPQEVGAYIKAHFKELRREFERV